MEPRIEWATVRISDSDEWIDIECRMSDGQKFVAIQVTKDLPQLAADLCWDLNQKNHA